MSAVEGDAITQMALSLQQELSEFADVALVASSILSPSLEGRVVLLDRLAELDTHDVLVYHASIGHEEIHPIIRRHSGTLAVVYHNITPSRFYEEFNPEFAELLKLGREQLAWYCKSAKLMIADSHFNAQELTALGCSRVETVPAGFSPSRLLVEPVDGPLLRELRSRFANGFVLVVGQVLPHKRIEQTIEAVHILNSTFHHNLGLVICGAQRQREYAVSLWEHMKSLPHAGVYMTGSVSDRHLATFLKSARLYLGMSDHEGLCLPPTEAMAAGTPVVVKGAGAVPETVGEGALVLSSEDGPVMAAEAMHEILVNKSLRARLVTNGYNMVKILEARSDTTRAAQLLRELVV